MICLDTQAWVRWVSDPKQLPRNVAARLAEDETCVSMISVWEVALLAVSGRLRLKEDISVFLEAATSWEGVSVVPITPAVAIRGARFGPLFPGDPADRLIAATALDRGVPLVTSDVAITRSGVVPVLWD